MTEYQERFTLRLPGYLHSYLKRVAKQQHRSLNNLIVHVLDEARRQAELPGSVPPLPPSPNVTGATADELHEYEGQGHA
jgi:hypothetical protein